MPTKPPKEHPQKRPLRYACAREVLAAFNQLGIGTHREAAALTGQSIKAIRNAAGRYRAAGWLTAPADGGSGWPARNCLTAAGQAELQRLEAHRAEGAALDAQAAARIDAAAARHALKLPPRKPARMGRPPATARPLQRGMMPGAAVPNSVFNLVAGWRAAQPEETQQ